jgi:hypothetical protein
VYLARWELAATCSVLKSETGQIRLWLLKENLTMVANIVETAMSLAHAQRIEEISKEAIALLGTGRQVVPFERRYPGFGGHRVNARKTQDNRRSENLKGMPTR